MEHETSATPETTATLEDKYQKAIKYLQENQPKDYWLDVDDYESVNFTPEQIDLYKSKVVEMVKIQNEIVKLNMGYTPRKVKIQFQTILTFLMCVDEEVPTVSL